MANGLEHLLSEGIVSEVVGRLKSGKEADVYAVQFGGRVVAAKVYKDRSHRSFKNNASYQEGRSVRNSRSQRAMDRKTSFGQASTEAAWKAAEADALYKLHAAEVRVPAPVLFLDGVLLMELVLDEAGEPAPRLIDTSLTVSQANAAYHDMLTQLVRILACDLIHGDLSPYNVLWSAKGPTIIDFPQIISASHNSSSEAFFLRDARNILGFFASIDRSLHARSSDAVEIWRAYVRRELTPEFVPMGRFHAQAPRGRGVEQGPHRHPPPSRDARPHSLNGDPQRPPPAAHGPASNAQRSPRDEGPRRAPQIPQRGRHVGSARTQPGGQAGPSRQSLAQRGGHGPGPQAAPNGSSGQNARQDRPRSGQGHRAGLKPESGHGVSGPRRPHVPEVIVRIARTPRAIPDAGSREEAAPAAADPKTQDTALQRPRSRG